MSDALNIMTPFGDVAALGQGYAQRADGEHLWLPMAQPLEAGAPVEFVILLADGTPAFAGAGQCLQVSDLGDQADPQVRFETALGALQFDERSQPVYDYIVAMHAAALEAQQQAGAQESAEAVGDVGDVGDVEAEAVVADEYANVEAEASFEDSEQAAVYAGEPVEGEQHEGDAQMYVADGLEADAQDEPPSQPSIIPKGMLQRPAIAMHWKPAPAQPPQASPSTGLFQYNGAGLPVPEAPPRPDIDPGLWVQPAGRPGTAVSQPPAAAEAVVAAEQDGYGQEGGYEEPAVEADGGQDEYAMDAEPADGQYAVEGGDDVAELAAEDADDGAALAVEGADDGAEYAVEGGGDVAELAAADGDDGAELAVADADDGAEYAAEGGDDVAELAVEGADDGAEYAVEDAGEVAELSAEDAGEAADAEEYTEAPSEGEAVEAAAEALEDAGDAGDAQLEEGEVR